MRYYPLGWGGIYTEPYFVSPLLRDHFLYCGKSRPALYLDPQVRAGISSFADLANQQEITDGLTQLAADIESGAIAERQAQRHSARGDYLFVTAQFSQTSDR